MITKGAERVSEVSARFTLDAMPGKQMSIDADLNAGLINEHLLAGKGTVAAINKAFFEVNAAVSAVFVLTTLADRLHTQ